MNPDTGKFVRHRRHFLGEIWDLDEATERSLASLAVDGKPYVAIVGDGGGFYDLDSHDIRQEIDKAAALTTPRVFALP